MAIASRLNKNVDHVAILVNGTPEIVLATANPNEDFVQVPDVSPPSLLPPRPGCVFAAELLAPLADRFVGDFHSALSEKIFDISEAQRESVVQPHGVANDLRREPVPTV